MTVTGDSSLAIIGLGYVGLPLAGAFHMAGHRVIGFDVDPAKLNALREGTPYLKHLGQELFGALARSDRFEATDDFSRLGEADAILICLPTPIGTHQEPDLTYVLRAGEQIGRCLRKGQLIVLESTTYPGTTRNELASAIGKHASTELVLGRDYFLAYSPEREDPGSQTHSTRTIPKLVGGLDESSTKKALALYRGAIDNIVPVNSAEIAESAKILENVFRAVNIAMVNELKVLFDRMGIDVWEVIEAAATKPFGFMPFYPGPGLGGHCIPIDPFYLTWKAKEYGLPTRFIELAGEVNHRMPEYVVHKCAHALNDRGRSIHGSKVLIVGMAYKPNVDDTRETPAVEIAEQLMELGAEVVYHDPHVATIRGLRKYPGLEMHSVDLDEGAVADADLVLIATDHDAVNWDLIGQKASLVVDTRNAMRRSSEILATVVKA
jgi:UDP-N-acetyl-D-glucosamine dehydrogenase